MTIILVCCWFFYYIRLLNRVTNNNFDLINLGFFNKILNSLFLVDLSNDSKKTKFVKFLISLILIVFIIVSILTLKANNSSLIFWIPVILVILIYNLIVGPVNGSSNGNVSSDTDIFLCVSCGMDYMNSSGYCDSCSKSRNY